MEVQRSGSKPSSKGPAEFFTGSVRVDPLIPTTPPARVSGAVVTFEPGARSAWHTHPLGQMIVVTTGCGLVQSVGGPAVKMRPGDVIWCPPGEKHWHGATATTGMSHLVFLESLDGKNVEWMEQVSDEEYAAAESAE
jgi:quercetin dioxygenase-like cupin family protein